MSSLVGSTTSSKMFGVPASRIPVLLCIGLSLVLTVSTQTLESTTGPDTSSLTTPPTSTPAKPKCTGTCYGSVMSIFCEAIDSSQGCAEGEYCCVRRASRTTPEPELPECKGYCTPTVLSGLCYRPAKLILKTLTCQRGTICCEDIDDSENEMKKTVW